MDYDGDEMACRPAWRRPDNRPGDNTVPPPKSVLIETLAFIDNEHNYTTAHGTRSDHGSIHVTFWIAHPPRVSYFTVDCPGQKAEKYPFIPRILAMDDDAVLIRVPVFGGEDPIKEQHRREFFIYQPGINSGAPKLSLLPDPNTASFADMDIGLLRCRKDDRFFVVAHSRVSPLNGDRHKRYLHLFDSKTWTWDTKLVQIESPESCSYIATHKFIKIGGEGSSTIGWVDLWHGILIYDVLLGNNVLRYISLPEPELRYPEGMPRTIRDIINVNGCIKYFRMYLPGIRTTYISGDWEADSWKMICPSENWQPDCKFKVSDIVVDHQMRSELLSNLPYGYAKGTVLRRLHAGNPALGLHNDDVLYILTKVQHHDLKGWVLAVNMRTKTLQGVSEFISSRNFAVHKAYTQSEISKHMGSDLKEDNDQSEASWSTVPSTKKQSGPRPRPAGTASCQSLPRGGEMATGVVQRGDHMGINNGCGSDVTGAGKVGGHGGGGRGCGQWPRQQIDAGRGGLPPGIVRRGDRTGINNGRGSDVSGADMGGRGGDGRWRRQQNGAGRGWQVRTGRG